jgi:hypothetical protein
MAEFGVEKWPQCMAEAKKFVEELKLVRNKIRKLKLLFYNFKSTVQAIINNVNGPSFFFSKA